MLKWTSTSHVNIFHISQFASLKLKERAAPVKRRKELFFRKAVLLHTMPIFATIHYIGGHLPYHATNLLQVFPILFHKAITKVLLQTKFFNKVTNLWTSLHRLPKWYQNRTPIFQSSTSCTLKLLSPSLLSWTVPESSGNSPTICSNEVTKANSNTTFRSEPLRTKYL